MMRIINPAGLALIKEYEGYRGHAYQDGVGVWTIGYGHTKGVQPGDTCTPTVAEQWLGEDLLEAETAVTRLVKVPLSDNQFAALVSLVFNIGATKFAQSNTLKLLNAGKGAYMPFYIRSFAHAGGEEVPGLARRREAEAALWSMAA